MSKRSTPKPIGRPRGIKETRPRIQATDACDEIFLTTLAQGKSISAAAAASGYKTRSLQKRRLTDLEFAQDWAEAYEAGTHAYEDEMRRRAIDGVKKPVYYQGVVVGEVTECSDILLQFALRARAPEKYRENVNVSGEVNHHHNHEFLLRDANDRARQAMAKLTAGPPVIDHV